MKKIIITGIIFILIGYLIGNYIFKTTSNYLRNKENKYYVLQLGVYNSRKALKNNINSIKQKIIDYENNKYYVYLGITKDKEVLEKLQEIYKKKGYNTITKEKVITSEEFSWNVGQFDMLIKENKDEDQIITIEEVVLANYDEIFKK